MTPRIFSFRSLKTILCLTGVMAVLGMLTSCGQKGPLHMPDTPKPPVEQSINDSVSRT